MCILWPLTGNRISGNVAAIWPHCNSLFSLQRACGDPDGHFHLQAHVGMRPRADAVDRHLAECGQDASLEVDAHGPAPGGLLVQFATAQVLVCDLRQGRGLLFPPDIVSLVITCAKARGNTAGAPVGFRKLPLAMLCEGDSPRRCLGLDRIGQRLQQHRRLADPVGECRAVEIDTIAGEYAELAVQRQATA